MSVTFTFDGCDDIFEVNLSNTNARMFLKGFKLPNNDELVGSWNAEQMRQVWDIIEETLVYQKFTPFLRETVEEGNFVYCGTNKEYVIQRLYDFRHLLIEAINEHKTIRYA